uniref:Uncharacterized protein n=1 Tax=Mycena chlorophos TaxID=658473 RepID=A0ABQ0LEU6_MYCCL|nr:predicted protein [Mycena chlorophos]
MIVSESPRRQTPLLVGPNANAKDRAITSPKCGNTKRKSSSRLQVPARNIRGPQPPSISAKCSRSGLARKNKTPKGHYLLSPSLRFTSSECQCQSLRLRRQFPARKRKPHAASGAVRTPRSPQHAAGIRTSVETSSLLLLRRHIPATRLHWLLIDTKCRSLGPEKDAPSVGTQQASQCDLTHLLQRGISRSCLCS